MRKSYLFLISALLSSLCGIAQAALHLELTQGVSGAIPLAVVASGESDETLSSLLSIVRADLEHSGRFRLPSSAQRETVPAGQTIDMTSWRKKHIEHVGVGKLSGGFGRHHLQWKLYDVFAKPAAHPLDQADKEGEQPAQTLVPAGSVPTVEQKINFSGDELRRAAHQVSDTIYQSLTGKPGVFSTRMAYVLVQQKHGQPPVYRLQVADADGANARTLLTSPQPLMSPAWSPDGEHLAYVSFEHHHATIFTQDVASGRRHVVAQFPGINGAPAWSPDGKKMAVVLSKSGAVKLYLLDMNSGDLQALTKGLSIDTEPRWAPDGESLVFTSNRGGRPQIYRLYLADQRVERLTFQGNYNARASITPDGKTLVMLHRENGQFSIAKQDLDTGRVTSLVRSDASQSPSVAPNGDMVLFATQYGRRGVLGMVSIDGRVSLRLPSRLGEVQEPAWSPFLHDYTS